MERMPHARFFSHGVRVVALSLVPLSIACNGQGNSTGDRGGIPDAVASATDATVTVDSSVDVSVQDDAISDRTTPEDSSGDVTNTSDAALVDDWDGESAADAGPVCAFDSGLAVSCPTGITPGTPPSGTSIATYPRSRLRVPTRSR
jgi:hypothetical protein